MAAIQPQQLNKLFVLLHRSLLQYVGECWPWTSEDGHETEILATVKSLIATQKRNESLLADQLNAIGWVVDFGGYPTLYTDLHYVSLRYLLKQIVTSQAQIVAAFDAAALDYEESGLLQQIAASERQTMNTVQSMTSLPAPTMKTA